MESFAAATVGNPEIFSRIRPKYPYEIARLAGPIASFHRRNAGRLRANPWSIGLQRQVTGNLMVEASYVETAELW